MTIDLTTDTTGATPGGLGEAPLFSADSHVVEETNLWEGILPSDFFEKMDLTELHKRPGRVDPVARKDEMAIDGVRGEVLYPSLALRLFGLQDADVQERCFRHYNDWLANFCATSPDQLIGIGLISCYDIDHTVAEVEHYAGLGLRGIQIWQEPPVDLPFHSEHYEPLWAAADRFELPVSLHILTGPRAGLAGQGLTTGAADSLATTVLQYRVSVNLKVLGVTDALLSILLSGALDRHPKLKLVLVENEIGWLPFVLDQWDYYVDRFKDQRPTSMEHLPSYYFGRQIFATFFRDPVGMKMFDWWGADGCMWSSDYPHGNSTWPHSQQVVADNLGYLSPEVRQRIVRGTALWLYGLADSRD